MSSDAAEKTMESNRICFIKVIECLQYLASSFTMAREERRQIHLTRYSK